MAVETTPLTSRDNTGTRRSKVFRVVLALAIATVAATALALVQSPSEQQASTTPRHVHTSSVEKRSSSFPGADDEILDLPGKPATYTSRLFSGYMPISNGGQGFYFLAESQSETPQTDPVLLWLNGGPGASSLEGCFTENGPLLVNEDGTSLRVNEFGWNKRANMLCIESPIGVGFSYNASGIYKSDDDAQAEDLYWMLQSFFDKFPWLRQNEFIVTGESAAGTYVPLIAKRIVEGNAEFKNDPSRQIKLKKFAVGNGVNEFAALSTVEFAYYHGMMSTNQYRETVEKCPELRTPWAVTPGNYNTECQAALDDANEQAFYGHVNPYGIYSNCSDSLSDVVAKITASLLGPPRNPPHPVTLEKPSCVAYPQVSTYFNLPSIRVAMHTKPEVETWNNAFTSINMNIHDLLPNATDSEIDAIIKNKVLDYNGTRGDVVTPFWRFLLDHGVNGVIYHGDTDMACDFIGGLWAVESLKLPRRQPRAIWTVPGHSQTAGFVEDFGSIKFVTVRGAGHMVPIDKPQEALALLDLFILTL